MMNVLVLKHAPQEGPGTLGARLRKRGVSCTVVELGAGEQCPGSPDPFDGLVVMGGPMNVYEEARYAFLADEDRLIRLALSRETPYLGICLGAQLLAKAADARVYRAAVEEIGWYQVSLTPEGVADPLFNGVDRDLTVFQWHGDTFAMPVGGRLLATAGQCPVQALKVGPAAYGLQFHVEMHAEMLAEWLADETATMTASARDEIRQSAATYGTGLRATAEIITDNFIGLMNKGA